LYGDRERSSNSQRDIAGRLHLYEEFEPKVVPSFIHNPLNPAITWVGDHLVAAITEPVLKWPKHAQPFETATDG
jgi:hypothetical protein